MKHLYAFICLFILSSLTTANSQANQQVERFNGKPVEKWLHNTIKDADRDIEETANLIEKQQEMLDSLNIKFVKIAELMLRHELSKKEAFFVSISNASIYTQNKRKVLFNKVTGEFRYANNFKSTFNEKVLYLGDVKNNVSFAITELKEELISYQELKRLLSPTSKENVPSYYSLTSVVPIQGFEGASLRVTTTATEQGFDTQLKEAHFEFRQTIDFDKLKTSNLNIIPTGHHASKFHVLKPFNQDVVFTNENNDVNALVISGHVNEVYAGLSAATEASVKLELLSRDAQNKMLIPPQFKKMCLDNYKPKDDSNDSAITKLMSVFDVTQSVFISPLDIVAQKTNGALNIMPLISRLDCKVKSIAGDLAVEMVEPKLLSSHLSDNKNKDLMGPNDLFDFQHLKISAINNQTGELYNLINLPHNLLRAIKKTYIDTITQHELDFMDEKGELN